VAVIPARLLEVYHGVGNA